MTAATGRDGPAGRAIFSTDPTRSRGRLHAEEESATRTAYQRDRDRIIHSTAFRRLKHKTQVFVYHEGDHYRTRLTHSLEVAQIARSLSRALGLDEDLAEALALAHDLGHPPFGHAGEEALQAVMAPYGGFDHNGQTLRILTKLEARYAAFDGLNLCWETLEGIAKHNGPLDPAAAIPWAVEEYTRQQDLELATWPGAEAQVASLADDIAYHTHDIDDGLRAGLFGIDVLRDVPLVGPAISDVLQKYPGLEQTRLIHETVRRVIDTLVNDLLTETRARIDRLSPQSVEDVRRLGQPLVGFSRQTTGQNAKLKEFLYRQMYRHYKVNRMTSKASRVVTELFVQLLKEPACLPEEWRRAAEGSDDIGTARLIADYIAGMTDRYALDEHRRFFYLYDEHK